MTQTRQSKQRLRAKRILICGKGGSGKSTITALMSAVLERRAYEVIVLDGDASNPEGLVRLLFGLGVEGEPRPLVEFFGGVDVVTCPVDDPAPLTRLDDTDPVPQRPIKLFEEISPDYYLKRGATTLLQVGKIQSYGQGCDGPLEKTVRDFMVEGDAVSLIDMKAGVEHFGRKIPDRMNIVLGVLDYTLESVSIAKKMAEFCQAAGIKDFWLILNKVVSDEVQAMLMEKLGPLQARVIGTLSQDPALIKAGLSGKALGECRELDEMELIVDRLEQVTTVTEPPR